MSARSRNRSSGHRGAAPHTVLQSLASASYNFNFHTGAGNSGEVLEKAVALAQPSGNPEFEIDVGASTSGNSSPFLAWGNLGNSSHTRYYSTFSATNSCSWLYRGCRCGARTVGAKTRPIPLFANNVGKSLSCSVLPAKHWSVLARASAESAAPT